MTNEEMKLEFNGKVVTFTEYKIITRKFIEKQAPTLEKLRELWIDDSKRRRFMDMLCEMQMDMNFIKETQIMEESDTFDVMANMVFEAPLITRKERVEQYLKAHEDEISDYGHDIKDITLHILKKYEKGGIENINLRILLNEDMLQKDAYHVLKNKMGAEGVAQLFSELKEGIYKTELD